MRGNRASKPWGGIVTTVSAPQICKIEIGQLGGFQLPGKTCVWRRGSTRLFYFTIQQSLQFLLPYIKCLLSRRREQPTTCFCICSTVQAELFTSSQWLSHMCLFWCWARIQTSRVLHRAGTFPAPALSSHEPSTPLRASWKTRSGWRTRGCLAQGNLSPPF